MRHPKLELPVSRVCDLPGCGCFHSFKVQEADYSAHTNPCCCHRGRTESLAASEAQKTLISAFQHHLINPHNGPMSSGSFLSCARGNLFPGVWRQRSGPAHWPHLPSAFLELHLRAQIRRLGKGREEGSICDLAPRHVSSLAQINSYKNSKR